MRHRYNDDHSIIQARYQAVGKTIQQSAANSGIDLLVEFRERSDQARRLIEFIQKTITQSDSLGFVPFERLIKLLPRGWKQ